MAINTNSMTDNTKFTFNLLTPKPNVIEIREGVSEMNYSDGRTDTSFKCAIVLSTLPTYTPHTNTHAHTHTDIILTNQLRGVEVLLLKLIVAQLGSESSLLC